MDLRIAVIGVSVALTLIGYLPYVWTILKARTRPHVFTWVIWALTTLLAGVVAVSEGGGLGAWPVVLSGSLAFVVAVLAVIKRGDGSITRLDWVFFLAALSALPVWALMRAPAWAALILTLVDLLGFAPSFRKSWSLPREDSLLFHALLCLRNFLVVATLSEHTIATTMFSLASGLASLTYMAMILWRRRVVEA